MLSLSTCNDAKIWNSFLEKEKDNQLVTIAHNPSLAAILEKTFGYSNQNSFIKKGDKIVGVMPMVQVRGKAISVPHFSYGGPVMSSKENQKLDLKSLLSGRKFEIRGFDKLTKFVNDKKIIAILKLQETAEEQMMDLKGRFRRKLRNAEKKNFVTKRGGVELLDDFYRVYSHKMRQKGSPPLGRVFFQNVLNDYKYGEAKITALYHENEVAAAGFTLSYLGFNELCWASSCPNFDKYNVNSLLYWRIIECSIDRGEDYFSMGRSTIDSSNHHYKRRWRPIEIPIYFNYSEKKSVCIKEFKVLNNLWKHQPMTLSVFLGHQISKYVY